MKYDVIVVGGGTAGCAAAYMLGKFGKKVLIIEKQSYLGGSMTAALVTPMMKTSDNSINNEFKDDFIKNMKKYNAAITYSDGNSGWFNPEIAKIVLDEMMKAANVHVYFNTLIKSVNIVNKNIVSIGIDNICQNNKMLSLSIETKYIVDATGNCDVGVLSNCEFINTENELQPTTLRFLMSGVDLRAFSDWLIEFDKDRNVTTVADIDGQLHLSTAYTWDNDKIWALKPLFDKGVEDGIIEDEDRNYFQIFTVPGMNTTIAFNCPRVHFDRLINPLDLSDYSQAVQKGRASILRISNFCKKYFRGFESAYISNIADVLGIRVSRRIRGKCVYTIENLKSGKKFKNPVLISNYPVDVHSDKKDKSILDKSIVEYQLPVEALMANDIDNLFVVGRCISADFYAQAALRIIPSCFSMGVGVAKFLNNRI